MIARSFRSPARVLNILQSPEIRYVSSEAPTYPWGNISVVTPIAKFQRITKIKNKQKFQDIHYNDSLKYRYLSFSKVHTGAQINGARIRYTIGTHYPTIESCTMSRKLSKRKQYGTGKGECEHCWAHRWDKATNTRLVNQSCVTFKVKYSWLVDEHENATGKYVLCETLGKHELIMVGKNIHAPNSSIVEVKIRDACHSMTAVEAATKINDGFIWYLMKIIIVSLCIGCH